MASCHHSRQTVVETATSGKDIADAVDANRTACGFGLCYKKIASLTVKIRERQATHPTFFRGANLRERHQTVPEAGPINTQRSMWR
jgi:hypothetical protein